MNIITSQQELHEHCKTGATTNIHVCCKYDAIEIDTIMLKNQSDILTWKFSQDNKKITIRGLHCFNKTFDTIAKHCTFEKCSFCDIIIDATCDIDYLDIIDCEYSSFMNKSAKCESHILGSQQCTFALYNSPYDNMNIKVAPRDMQDDTIAAQHMPAHIDDTIFKDNEDCNLIFEKCKIVVDNPFMKNNKKCNFIFRDKDFRLNDLS